ncbi:hypothetical protein KBY65_13650 [Cyanobium sp. Alchichica 3B3-8F6]|nr:hypothetical protein [Cyanobium sp. Alchichica 3B3-8F6]
MLTDSLGIELKRPPSDSVLCYLFLQLDVTADCGDIQDSTIDHIPGASVDHDQLNRDGHILIVLMESNSGGGSAFIAYVLLYSAGLDVLLAQILYATTKYHMHYLLEKQIGELDLGGVLIDATALFAQQACLFSLQSRCLLPGASSSKPEDARPADRRSVDRKAPHTIHRTDQKSPVAVSPAGS